MLHFFSVDFWKLPAIDEPPIPEQFCCTLSLIIDISLISEEPKPVSTGMIEHSWNELAEKVTNYSEMDQ